MSNRKLAVVVGGNSLVKDELRKSLSYQYLVVKETAHHNADMIEAGWELAIGHGVAATRLERAKHGERQLWQSQAGTDAV